MINRVKEVRAKAVDVGRSSFIYVIEDNVNEALEELESLYNNDKYLLSLISLQFAGQNDSYRCIIHYGVTDLTIKAKK